MSLLVAALEDEAATATREFGAKAARLASLRRAGFPVPDGFAVARTALRRAVEPMLQEHEWPARLLAAGVVHEDALAAIRARVASVSLDPDLSRALELAYARLGAGPVAVRSSADAEDGAAFAGAGIQETFLNVRGQARVEQAVRECWASLWTERSLGYLARSGGEAGMGVVVQDLVAADVAGVAFTQDPLSGDPEDLVINCAFGLGPAVAQGLVSPDAYVIDRRTGRVRERLAGDKRVEVAPDGDGVAVRARPPEAAGLLALSDREASIVAELALAVERHLGRPADIEWAIAGGRISLLQARPVTVAAARPKPVPARTRRARTPPEKTVWSNANVGEALPGVATPLTWSVLSAFSDRGFRHAFGALGCKVPADAELVGEVRGRIYLNLSEFMAIASQVPGLSPRTLLSLGGGGGLDELEDAAPQGRVAWLVRLPATIGRLAKHHAGLGSRIEAFERGFDRERAAFAARDLARTDRADLGRALSGAEDALHRTGELMLSAASSFLASYVLLRSLLRRWLGTDAARLEVELMSGFSDLESAAPGIALCHIAEAAKGDAAARRFFETDPADLRLADLPAGPLRRALDAFLAAHGHRAPREAELSTPRWREDPTLVLAALRALMLGDGARGLERVERQRRVRARAVEEVERRLGGPRRSAIRHALASAQRNARLRERLRSRVTEVLGWFRAIALEIGSRMGEREAGFFLELEEIHGWLGDATFDPRPIVRARRIATERNRRLPDPPPTFVGRPGAAPAPVRAGEALAGLAASPGRASGPVRVILDPAAAAAFVPGEVLVVGSADVGWAPLFLSAAAVVAELGGPLSHAAIVAREYGVPMVVNACGATRVLRTGEVVHVDGAAGTVVRLGA